MAPSFALSGRGSPQLSPGKERRVWRGAPLTEQMQLPLLCEGLVPKVSFWGHHSVFVKIELGPEDLRHRNIYFSYH
jgi:hypothetical protein